MTPDAHAAKARELLDAASVIHRRLLDRVMSGDIADDQTIVAVVGLTAALAHVHATLATIATIRSAPAPRSTAPANYPRFGKPDDAYEDSLLFPGEDDPGPPVGYADDVGKAVLDAQDDDSSADWDGLS